LDLYRGSAQLFCEVRAVGAEAKSLNCDFHEFHLSIVKLLWRACRWWGRTLDVRTSVAYMDARYAEAAKFCALEMPRPSKRTGRQACIQAFRARPMRRTLLCLEVEH